jgi:hypothetical protein
MKEGVTTTMKRRKGEGLAAPLMGGCPLSPIYMLDIPLKVTFDQMRVSIILRDMSSLFN